MGEDFEDDLYIEAEWLSEICFSSYTHSGAIRFEKEQDRFLLSALRLHVAQVAGEMSFLQRVELLRRGINC